MAGAPRHILALDQGTSSSRAIVFDERARPIGVAQREVASRYPRPGWVEQDADELVWTQVAAAREALEHAGIEPDDVAAIGIANQRETTVAWGADGRTVTPAIVWQDRRTSDRCTELRRHGREPDVRARTGLLLDPYFSATKMGWLLDAIPDGPARAEAGDLHLGTVDSYLLWRLTGGREFATDATNASRTMLFDIRTMGWSPELLELFRVPRMALPEVRATDAPFGETDASVLGASVPVRAIAGDQQAALFGQRCVQPGSAKNTYGTGCFLLVMTGSDVPEPPPGLLATVAWQRAAGTRYALEGSVFVAGGLVRWLRDELSLVRSAPEIEPLAASVPDSAEVVIVPAFNGLGAPYWDAEARGAIFGLTAGTTAAHLARAALESIAHQTVDLIEALASGGAASLHVLRADGGAAANDLLLQLQADLVGVPVERATIAETTALGAALLAGRAAGVWSSDEELADLLPGPRVFLPERSDSWRREMRARWTEAVGRVTDRAPNRSPSVPERSP